MTDESLPLPRPVPWTHQFRRGEKPPIRVLGRPVEITAMESFKVTIELPPLTCSRCHVPLPDRVAHLVHPEGGFCYCEACASHVRKAVAASGASPSRTFSYGCEVCHYTGEDQEVGSAPCPHCAVRPVQEEGASE